MLLRSRKAKFELIKKQLVLVRALSLYSDHARITIPNIAIDSLSIVTIKFNYGHIKLLLICAILLQKWLRSHSLVPRLFKQRWTHPGEEAKDHVSSK